jgi:hypothetical protein
MAICTIYERNSGKDSAYTFKSIKMVDYLNTEVFVPVHDQFLV